MTAQEAQVMLGARAKLGAVVSSVLAVREIGVLVAFVLICLVLSVSTPFFLVPDNLLAVARQISLLGIICMGMTMVLVSGEFDLSVGSIYGLAGVVSAFVLVHTHSWELAFASALVVGATFGLFNGLITTYGRIPSFIVTLGTLNIGRGIALVVTQGFPVVIEGVGVPAIALNTYLALGRPELFGVVPVQILYFLVAIGVGVFLLHFTVFGYHAYAVGGSQLAARSAGINPNLTKTAAFFLTAILAAIAGASSAAFIGNALPMAGQGLEFDCFAGVIIGGTAISGGAGTILGTVIGVALIGVLRNGLVLLGVSSFWQQVAIGTVVIIAVAIDRWLTRRR